MREFDVDSYCRKWRQTYGFYTTKGELLQGWFAEFFEIDRNVIGVEVHTPDGTEKRFSLEDPYPDYEMAQIEYHPIDSGWYTHRHGFGLLVRRHVRGFSQGLSNNNHVPTIYTPEGKEKPEMARYNWCNFLQRPTFSKLNPAVPFGIMKERIWWKDGLIYFLNRAIGCYKGNKVTMESSAFIPYIKPLVEETCQIN
jgi:hypothetical protein